MLKSIAAAVFIVIIFTGLLFLALDVLDIGEDFRLELPIATINTILISAVAIPILIYTGRSFLKSDSPIAFCLGGAVLSFGFSILLYGWLVDTDLNTRITAYDTGVLFSAIFHALGGGYLYIRREQLTNSSSSRVAILSTSYVILLFLISLITWLAHEDIITFVPVSIGINLTVRDIIQGTAFILCFGAAAIYMREYLKVKIDYSFWYSIGLVLFATGVIFISRGPLESRIAWIGRLAEYTGGIYMLLAAYSMNKEIQHKSSR